MILIIQSGDYTARRVRSPGPSRGVQMITMRSHSRRRGRADSDNGDEERAVGSVRGRFITNREQKKQRELDDANRRADLSRKSLYTSHHRLISIACLSELSARTLRAAVNVGLTDEAPSQPEMGFGDDAIGGDDDWEDVHEAHHNETSPMNIYNHSHAGEEPIQWPRIIGDIGQR